MRVESTIRAKSWLLFLCAVVPVGAAGAQEGAVHDAVAHEEPPRLLALRLEPGKIWRQRVKLRSTVDLAEGATSSWSQEYLIRLKCLEVEGDLHTIEAAFVDWTLELETGLQSFEWREQRYRQEGLAPADADQREAAKDLLRAWAAGLRKAVIRFELDGQGVLHRPRGFEVLRQQVDAATRALEEDLPKGLAIQFGDTGLARAETAIGFALSAPRPVEPVSVGARWERECWIQGIMPGPCRLSRSFLFEGEERERRHRLANILFAPVGHWQDQDGALRPVIGGSAEGVPAELPEGAEEVADEEIPPSRLQLLLDSGLLYRMHMDVRYELPEQAGVVHCRLDSSFED